MTSKVRVFGHADSGSLVSLDESMLPNRAWPEHDLYVPYADHKRLSRINELLQAAEVTRALESAEAELTIKQLRATLTTVQECISHQDFMKVRRLVADALSGVRQDETKSLHVTECNYQRGPIGGEGCVCVVVNKHTLPPAPPRQVADCKHERARLLCEDCRIDFRNIPQRHPTEDSPVETTCTAADYEEVLEDHRRLVRELDVALNGAGAAKQASLCDIVAQIKDHRWKLVRAEEIPPDSEPQRCEDTDGCPTEVAVLKRFWRLHRECIDKATQAAVEKFGPPIMPSEETECDREDPKARIGSPEHTQAEAIRTLKASVLCESSGATHSGFAGQTIPCPSCGKSVTLRADIHLTQIPRHLRPENGEGKHGN